MHMSVHKSVCQSSHSKPYSGWLAGGGKIHRNTHRFPLYSTGHCTFWGRCLIMKRYMQTNKAGNMAVRCAPLIISLLAPSPSPPPSSPITSPRSPQSLAVSKVEKTRFREFEKNELRTDQQRDHRTDQWMDRRTERPMDGQSLL